MINVEQIYQSLRDLSSKGKGGYMDSDEFNKNSKRAELLLWQYYCSRYEDTQVVPDSMYPFLKETGPTALDSDMRAALPIDFGHRVYVRCGTAVNVAGGNPVVTYQALDYLEKYEEMNTLSSPIRGPKPGNMAYAYAPGGKLQFYPVLTNAYSNITYLRYPVYGVRGFTNDLTNDEQVYNSSTSVQYEWPEQEENNLIDLILLFQGITIRDSQIIQWAQNHQSITPAIVKTS